MYYRLPKYYTHLHPSTLASPPLPFLTVSVSVSASAFAANAATSIVLTTSPLSSTSDGISRSRHARDDRGAHDSNWHDFQKSFHLDCQGRLSPAPFLPPLVLRQVATERNDVGCEGSGKQWKEKPRRQALLLVDWTMGAMASRPEPWAMREREDCSCDRQARRAEQGMGVLLF